MTEQTILFEWTVHPLRDTPLKSVLLILIIISMSAIVLITTHDRWMFVLSVVILVGSTGSYLFPTKYRLTENQIVIRNWLYWRTRKWTEFRNYVQYNRSIKLTTLTDVQSRLNHYRGILLQLPEDCDNIIQYVKKQIDEGS